MKKLFILAAAIVAFASCSKNEPQATVVPTREIKFATAAETRATTATVETATTLQTNGFSVWGYMMTAPQATIFEKVDVKYNSTSRVWEPVEDADVKYWSAGNKYWFSAMAPKSLEDYYSFTTDGTTHNQSISEFTIAADNSTPDLIVAKPAYAVLGDNETSNEAVGLTFDHMLSRVKFTFTNKFADDNVTIEISNVTLNDVLAKGDATITSTGVATWTPNGDGTIDAVYGTENEIVANAAQNEVKETVYRYIIPQTATYTVSFDLVVKADGQTVLTKSYKDVSLANTAFVNGKGYVFNANISGDLLEEELHPIQFTVKVTEWVDNDPVDINLTGK